MSRRLQPQHIQPIIMAGIMACLMTAFITWLNLGFSDRFLFLWGRAFVIAWPLASAAAFVATPIAPKIAKLLLAAIYGAE